MHVILNLPIWDVGVIGPVSPKSERVLSKPLRLGRVGRRNKGRARDSVRVTTKALCVEPGLKQGGSRPQGWGKTV